MKIPSSLASAVQNAVDTAAKAAVTTGVAVQAAPAAAADAFERTTRPALHVLLKTMETGGAVASYAIETQMQALGREMEALQSQLAKVENQIKQVLSEVERLRSAEEGAKEAAAEGAGPQEALLKSLEKAADALAQLRGDLSL